MANEPGDDSPKPISRDFRTGIAIATLGLDYVGVALILILGEPSNSLHSSGLAWLSAAVLAILAGLGVAAIAPKAIENLTSK